MSTNVPKVDLDFAMQFLGQLYGSIAAINDARKKVGEVNSQASAAETKLRETERQFFEKEKMLREITGKLEQAQRLLDERVQQAEEARMELSGVQARLDELVRTEASLDVGAKIDELRLKYLRKT